MSWFEHLTGITEQSPQQVRNELSVAGENLVCPNGNQLAFGSLETPSLSELRSRLATTPGGNGRLQVRQLVADVQSLHRDPANAGALFQVASQFNLLEMASPDTTPEEGVGIYEYDHTQGPICAISCGAGTIYRNYFAPVGNHIGQSTEHQIDCSADLGTLLGNSDEKLWNLENGYLFPTDAGLAQITSKITSADESERDRYRAALRIGLQWNAAVTLPEANHRVSQAYCSALPVTYGNQPTDQWTEFAKLVLEATYEATFCAAILNSTRNGKNKLFLTLVGGGVFGNRIDWITAAIHRAIEKYRQYEIDVAIVTHKVPKPSITELIERLSP
jgi:hypothetical protein